MLTTNKPAHHGYRLVHDLPTPPSTSRPSPPLIYQESGRKALVAVSHGSCSSDQPMSAPHRGLPPPAAMTLVQQLPPGSAPPQPPGPPGPPLGHAPPHHSSQQPPPPQQQQQQQQQPPPPPPPLPQVQVHSQYPAAPLWSHVSEESMRTYLMARAEEEKRKQEEEKTRQESYRLEQRRMEHDIIRTSLQGGIPPPMIPVVFAGMGSGTLSQAALEWARQYLGPQPQHAQPQALMPPEAVSSEHHHHRGNSQTQVYGHYAPGVPSTPGSTQGPPSGYAPAYASSPTRPRGQSMPGQMNRPPGTSNPAPLNTSAQPSFGGPGHQPHSGISSAPQSQDQQHPSQSPLYILQWQPPTTGRDNPATQPATPSGSSKTKTRS